MTDANTTAARMVAACTSGDEATVRKLLRETPSLASQVPGAPLAPLHYAVRDGHAGIVQLLLEHGADAHVVVGGTLWGLPLRTVDVAVARGFGPVVALIDKAIEASQRLALSEDPLRRALRESDLAAIQRELRRDPSAINTTDEHGNTPLHRAAQAEDTADSAEFMNFLLDHGAAVDVPNHLGYTPVYVTLFPYRRPRWKMFELLLARGAPYDINLACVKGDIDRVRSLLAADAGAVHFQAPCKKRPLSCAAEFGRRNIVALLLAAGADPNAQEAEGYHTFPLVAAVKNNDLAMVQMLLEHGADPNAMIDAAEVALSEAIGHGNRDMANLIASYGGVRPIHCLAWEGDIVTLAAVLHENPRLALSAIYIPNPDRPKEAARALRLALHHGLNPKDICLWSLFRASGKPELLRVFLEAGADPDVTDEDGTGCTLLHFLTGFPETKPAIEVLLEFKANIDARDGFFGFTPLTWAVVHRRLDMVQFLLARGATIELPDDPPWTTPRFWAKHLGEPAIMQALAD
ncbi:MAG TPA: ankyrin repeat domain-containing protein [Pirellulales bacterium]|nr:ankyrin repeat domain-containing protein [Pirellulales bacterium]